MYGVFRQTRANLPSRYVFSVVRLAPPSTPTAERPCASWIASISAADSARSPRSYGIGAEAAAATTDRGASAVVQPVGMRALQVALDALRAEHAAVERELLPRLEADDLVVADLELDAALLAAEAAVRLDEPVRLDVVDSRTPVIDDRCGPKRCDDPELVDGKGRHAAYLAIDGRCALIEPLAPCAPCASPNSARRQRGQICW